MAISVRPLEPPAEDAWDRFVSAHPHGTFFHRAAWADIMRRAFGHTPLYAMAEQDGAITGVLPLTRVKSLLFGHTLISSPFCVYGGPIANDRESLAALDEYALDCLRRTGASALEYRCREEPITSAEDWQARDDLYVTFRRPIAANDDDNLKAIPRKQRAMVRKGLERGLTSRADQDVRTLHRIYAESVRNLGTPVFGLSYFRLLADRFSDQLDVVTISDQGEPVAAVLNFYDRDEVLPYYGGGRAVARSLAANDFMYWEVMRRAAARGCRLFDFGRSKVGTGAFAFKKNWGFTPQPLRHRFRLKPGEAIPEHNPLNPKYRLFIETWKRLPLPVANAVGPFIVRGIG